MAHDSRDDRYSVTSVDIDDPAAANAGSELVDLHAVQFQSRPFKARRIIVRLSERTLEYAFKEVMGLAPMAYLARLRLHRVRQALLAATNGPTTVAAAAVEWGFWHFGEFSRAYKECFGELPSETLRRRDYQPPDREPASEPR